MNRDPRQDPQRGDVLLSKDALCVFVVLDVTEHGMVRYVAIWLLSGSDYSEHSITRKTWREMSGDDRVLYQNVEPAFAVQPATEWGEDE